MLLSLEVSLNMFSVGEMKLSTILVAIIGSRCRGLYKKIIFGYPSIVPLIVLHATEVHYCVPRFK